MSAYDQYDHAENAREDAREESRIEAAGRASVSRIPLCLFCQLPTEEPIDKGAMTIVCPACEPEWQRIEDEENAEPPMVVLAKRVLGIN